MLWQTERLDWFLYSGLALEVIAVAIIFEIRPAQQWIGSLLIVAGLLLIGVYLFSRTVRIRKDRGFLDPVSVVAISQAFIVIALAVVETGLLVSSLDVQSALPADGLRWAARILVVLLVAAVAVGLITNGRSHRPGSGPSRPGGASGERDR
jgi:drug/metabolite transporter (DMT)-like permease